MTPPRFPSNPWITSESSRLNLSPHPAVRRVEVEISAPADGEKQSTAGKVREALKVSGCLHTDIPDALLPTVLDVLQQHAYKVSLVLRGEQLTAALPPDLPMLGLAVDLGTTTLGATLLDLQSGQVLAATGALNPQMPYGEDGLRRIRYAEEHAGGRQVLQQILVKTINKLVMDLVNAAGASSAQVLDCVMVGNPFMQHLLAGLPVHSLAAPPFQPARLDAMTFPAAQIGLALANGAEVYLPPNISGSIGGDHIAALLTLRARHTLKTVLALDAGTQTEISLLHKGRHLTCACPSNSTEEATLAAIRAGVDALMQQMVIEPDDIDIVLAAGGYGIDLGSLLNGLAGAFPDLAAERFQQAGNAAGKGACELLLSTLKREEAEGMPETIEIVNLAPG